MANKKDTEIYEKIIFSNADKVPGFYRIYSLKALRSRGFSLKKRFYFIPMTKTTGILRSWIKTQKSDSYFWVGLLRFFFWILYQFLINLMVYNKKTVFKNRFEPQFLYFCMWLWYFQCYLLYLISWVSFSIVIICLYVSSVQRFQSLSKSLCQGFCSTDYSQMNLKLE